MTDDKRYPDAGETLVDQMPDAFFDEDHSDENPTVSDVDELTDPTPQPPQLSETPVEAEAVKRWSIVGAGRRIHHDGEWVRFTDHEAALKAKTDEIERWKTRATEAERMWDFWNKKALSLAQKSDAAEASNKRLEETIQALRDHVRRQARLLKDK